MSAFNLRSERAHRPLPPAGVLLVSGLVMLALCPLAALGQLKLNEVYYNVLPQGGYQYVELLNAASTNVYLDGLVLTDEAGFGVEGVYQFPGTPGGTNLAVIPGQRVVIAVDATADTIFADWECYAGGTDFDSPSVSNLTRVAGDLDLGFFAGGDNCLLANGTDVTIPIDIATVIDGVNFGDGGGELAPVSASTGDFAPGAATGLSQTLGRCPDGNDNDFGSLYDFVVGNLTPDAPNTCLLPLLSVNDATVMEINRGLTNAFFVVSLSPPPTGQVAVTFLTSNGTASAGSDYRGVAGTQLVFSAGSTIVTVQVPIVGDVYYEGDEDFTARLRSPTNAMVVGGWGQGLIIDNDVLAGNFTSEFYQITSSGTSVTAVWSAISGRTYQVQFGPVMSALAWTNLGGVVTASETFVTTVDLTDPAPSQRLYRVLQLDDNP